MPSPSVILDPTDDSQSRVELVKLARQYEFPKFVKEANLDITMAPTQIAVTAYADPVRRKFACHTPAATWLSSVYFHEKAAEYHSKDRERIQSRLEKFADYFAIRSAYDAVVKRAAELRGSNELPDSSYAYVWSPSNGGPKERYYPLDTPPNIKAAAEWLERERDAIPFHDRNVIANKILEKAASKGAALGEDLTEFVEKQAGRGIPDPPELYEMLERRAALARNAQHREAITKLAASVKSTPRVALQPRELIKLATTVDMIDHAIGLKGKYTALLPRPEEVIFKVSFTKAASDHATLCPLQSGSVFSKEQFGKLARSDVEGLFGSEFAAEVCTGLDVDPEKFAEVASTLPLPDATLLEALLSESGQHAQMHKGASYEPVDNETLEALAAAYK
jgi:hypothetical protein